jgi:hypothetical protein
MRLRGLGCWASLTGVLSALAVASGCDIVPKGGDEGGPSGDKPIDPGSMQRPPGDNGPYPPGGTGSNGTPVVRKLALDLRGVAGFAILDPEADASGSTAGDGSMTASASPGAGVPGAGGVSGSGSKVMWLGSSSVGQELRARPSVDAKAVRDTIMSRRAVGDARSGTDTRRFAAQEDPGSTPPAPGDQPAPPPSPDGSGEASSASEQAGLLKITEQGQVEPALIALEETPIEAPSAPSADAGVPPSVPNGGGSGTPPTGVGGATSGPGAMPGTGGAPSPGGMMPPMQHLEPLPRVTAVGLSPDGNVYILFERSFMHRQPSAEDMASGVDLYGPSSPFRCQLFRANGSWQQAAAELAELECVTNQHEVRTWDARRVMQFDASGKLYFRAGVPAQPKEVFYQYDPATRVLSEKVNGNICWRDVQVTPRGSLFYTGSSTSSDGGCGGTSFFRYVSTDNRLSEIARDWWNFKYLAEQDPEDPNNERIIFYGPDPNSTSSVGWDTACLYRYDPAVADPVARTERLVECNSNPFNYVYGASAMPGQVSDAELAAFGERCHSEGQLFVGGEGVTGLSQLRDGTLFVVGKFQKKLAGEVRCGLDVNVDHCDSADPAHATQEACTGAGRQWLHAQPYCEGYPEAVDPGSCATNEGVWNNGVGFRHYDAAGASCLTPQTGFSRGYLDCRGPGQAQTGPQPMPNLMQEVNGLAYLAPREAGGFELRLVSEPTEEVERYWAIEGENGPELYYSVYQSGQYNLRLATQVDAGDGQVEVARRLLLEDYEVYNLQRDPADPSRVMFDALQFATNEYLFGSADTTLPTPEEVLASVQAVQGVSGRVETLIVLPNF